MFKLVKMESPKSPRHATAVIADDEKAVSPIVDGKVIDIKHKQRDNLITAASPRYDIAKLLPLGSEMPKSARDAVPDINEVQEHAKVESAPVTPKRGDNIRAVLPSISPPRINKPINGSIEKPTLHVANRTTVSRQDDSESNIEKPTLPSMAPPMVSRPPGVTVKPPRRRVAKVPNHVEHAESLERAIPENHVEIKTSYGSYIVPLYDIMSVEEKQRHRDTFQLKFNILNDSWNRLGMSFELPNRGETLTNIHVRYKQAVKFVMTRSGLDLYKIVLVCGWMAVELICCKIGLKASGYAKSQLAIYDIYHAQLVELGEIGGFGEGWPPWLKILIISAVNIGVLVLANTVIEGSGANSGEFMKLISNLILGRSDTMATTTDDNDMGVPQPANPLAALMGGGGNFMQGMDLTSMITSVGTMMSANMQNGAAPAATGNQAANNRPAARRPRRRGPSVVA